MNFSRSLKIYSAAILSTLLITPAAFADSGFYIGGSVGNAALSSSDLDFDDKDSAFKGFGGFIFDLPAVDFGIEAGYVDMGGPSETILGQDVEFDVSALSAFGTLGVDFGLFGFFAKAGLVSWDADVTIDNVDFGSDTGTDGAYGLGFRFNFSSAELRAEYEVFDVGGADVDMISVGAVWRF